MRAISSHLPPPQTRTDRAEPVAGTVAGQHQVFFVRRGAQTVIGGRGVGEVMVVMRDGGVAEAGLAEQGSQPALAEIRLEGGDQRNGDALAQAADHRRLSTIGVEHVVAGMIAAEHLIAAVGGGQQSSGPMPTRSRQALIDSRGKPQ